MAYKRKRSSPGGPFKRRRVYARRGASMIRAQRGARAFGRGVGLRKLIKSTMLSMAESKHVYRSVQNLVLEHNELRVISNNLFGSVQGTDHENRIGDKIFAKYMQFKMYFENQQYRPKASYLILVLRNKTNASANITDGENIFEDVTSSRNLDYIDYNKYQVLYRKRIIVNDQGSGYGTANTMNNTSVDGTARVDTGVYVVNAARYHTFNLRLNRTIEYLDGADTPSTMKYALAVIPYANYSTTTSGTTYPVGHVSICAKFVFKDP